MRPALQYLLRRRSFDPWRLPNNAAIYSLRGSESDATWLSNGLGRLRLVADRSGNSNVNCLVLNGAAGNYASVPDSVPLSVTGDITFVLDNAPNSVAPAATSYLYSKFSTGVRSYGLYIATTGHPTLIWSPTGADAAIITAPATATLASVGITAFQRFQLAATLDVDNGASGNDTKFWYNIGAGWVQLGNTVTNSGTTSIYDSTTALYIGANTNATGAEFDGLIYRARMYSGVVTNFDAGTGGTLVLDADFTRVAKLAATFTESSANAATVTINTSGDLGARISGARDLVQFTTTKMALLSVGADGKRIATFDGSNDYMKAAPFQLSQPESVYFVGSQVTWSDTEAFYDGNSISERMKLGQSGSSPSILLGTGSAPVASTWAIGARAAVAAIVNGAESSLRVNASAAVVGDAGTSPANGFTLGSVYSGASAFVNATFNETILASRADNDALQLKINRALMRKWNVS